MLSISIVCNSRQNDWLDTKPHGMCYSHFDNGLRSSSVILLIFSMYSIYAYLEWMGGEGHKSLKKCLRNIWMVP